MFSFNRPSLLLVMLEILQNKPFPRHIHVLFQELQENTKKIFVRVAEETWPQNNSKYMVRQNLLNFSC